MLFYILLFAGVVLAMIMTNMLERERDKKIVIMILFVGLTIISGTRFELGGNDYYVYRRGYEAIPTLQNFYAVRSSIQGIRLVDSFEIGYLFLNSFVKTLGINYYGFTLIESVIWYACMYKGLKRYVDDWAIVIIVFLYKLFFYNTFISMRQSITIALFFLAFQYIQDKKIVKYYIVCTVGLLFHNGAILLFVLYPILQFRLTKKRLLLMNVVCWTLYALDKLGYSIFNLARSILELLQSDSVLIVKLKEWLSVPFGLSTFHILEYMLLMLLVIIYFEKILKSDENAEFILKIFVCLLPILAIFGGNIISTRFKDYFTITYGIVLMYLCRIDRGRLKYVVQLGTVTVCAYGYFRYLYNFDGGGLLPYVSYLTKGLGIFY